MLITETYEIPAYLVRRTLDKHTQLQDILREIHRQGGAVEEVDGRYKWSCPVVVNKRMDMMMDLFIIEVKWHGER